MRVLAIGRPRPGVDARTAIARHARDELRDRWALHRDGPVREMFSPGGPGIVLILEAASLEASNGALSELFWRSSRP
jgi:hypothetical protein